MGKQQSSISPWKLLSLASIVTRGVKPQQPTPSTASATGRESMFSTVTAEGFFSRPARLVWDHSRQPTDSLNRRANMSEEIEMTVFGCQTFRQKTNPGCGKCTTNRAEITKGTVPRQIRRRIWSNGLFHSAGLMLAIGGQIHLSNLRKGQAAAPLRHYQGARSLRPV